MLKTTCDYGKDPKADRAKVVMEHKHFKGGHTVADESTGKEKAVRETHQAFYQNHEGGEVK